MAKPTGRLAIMGHIEVVEPDGEHMFYPKALLIAFDSTDDLRQAISDMEVKLINYHDIENKGQEDAHG